MSRKFMLNVLVGYGKSVLLSDILPFPIDRAAQQPRPSGTGSDRNLAPSLPKLAARHSRFDRALEIGYAERLVE